MTSVACALRVGFISLRRPLLEAFRTRLNGPCSTLNIAAVSNPYWFHQTRCKIYRNEVTADIPEVPFHELLLARCREKEDRIALVDEVSGKSYTYREFIRYVTKFASSLHKHGFKKGDVYCSYAPNSVELAIAFIGVAAAGGVMSLANPTYTPGMPLHTDGAPGISVLGFARAASTRLTKYVGEVVNHLKISDASYFHTRTLLMENALSALNEYKKIKPESVIYEDPSSSSGRDFWQMVDQGDEEMPKVDFDVKRDVCFLPFSSGTTGLPKGTMLTHHNVVAHTIMINFIPKHAAHKDGDEVTAIFPFFHAGGSTVGLINFLYHCCTIHIRPRFVLEEMLHDLERFKLEKIILPPTIIRLMAYDPRVDDYDLSSLKSIGVGAAPVGPVIEEAVKKRLNIEGVEQGYGLTEVSGITHSTVGHGITKGGSIGRLFPSVEAKVIDLDSGDILPQGATGELCMRTPTIMLGYLGNPKATAETIDSEGWLHTGDIARVDEEGNFFIIDRKKELIKTKGFQVAPAELEDTILHHPAVQDAAVIGIEDVKSGEEVPRAYVVKQQGKDVSEEEIKQHVAERLAHYKHLRGGVQFVKDIPKLPSGKILRRVLQDQYKAQMDRS